MMSRVAASHRGGLIRIRLAASFVVVLAACTSPPSTSSPVPVSPTPDVVLGTPIGTRTAAPTASPRPLPTIAKPPQEVLLVLADLPAGFKLTVDREATADDIAASANAADKAAVKQQLIDRGFVGSWFREFTRDAFFGALFIRSSATKYAAIEGAKFGIATNVQQTTQTSGGVQISLGESIGDESYGIQLDTTSGTTQGTSYIVYFRVANVSNTIAVVGIKGTVDVATAIDLSKKQLAKLKA